MSKHVNNIPSREVFVFRTTIKEKSQEEAVRQLLRSILEIAAWNIDTDDIDCILRIEASQLDPRKVENLLNEAGYFCEELPD